MERDGPARIARRKVRRRTALLVLSLSVAAMLLSGTTALGQTPGAECVPNEADGSCLPVAAESDRVDLVPPTFSEPTTITNPLFPISQLHSVVMLGRVDRLPFHTEVTLLPETKTIEWNGQAIETLTSQYTAYLDGRIQEVALDWYAQADDGSVWYFGEDVFNYADGMVADTTGTWLAGKDGPAAMIMPANPQVGDVYRTENIPGVAFEEVTVNLTDQTVHGPEGPIVGAIVVEELHQDGTTEKKIFAPGYGEFLTGQGGELEALALAVPTDAQPNSSSPELEILATGAADIYGAAQSEDWAAASTTLDAMLSAWDAYKADDVSTAIDSQMDNAFVYLVAAVDAHQSEEASQAALDAERAGLDLLLRQQSPAEIDRARFDLLARQLLLDAVAEDVAGVNADVTTLEWVWDRIAHTMAPDTAKQIEVRLTELRNAADAQDLATVGDGASGLHDLLAES
jgi:hypothetical protein